MTKDLWWTKNRFAVEFTAPCACGLEALWIQLKPELTEPNGPSLVVRCTC